MCTLVVIIVYNKTVCVRITKFNSAELFEVFECIYKTQIWTCLLKHKYAALYKLHEFSGEVLQEAIRSKENNESLHRLTSCVC